MKVERWVDSRDGEMNAENMVRKMEIRGFRVNIYTYPPGTYFAPHMHAVDKIDGVLSGRFKMTMGSDSVVLEAGDMLSVPKGEVHSAEVLGDEPVVSLDGVWIET